MRRIAPLLCAFCILMGIAPHASARTVVDALGRAVEIPDEVSRVICSGAGCLRLLTYLQAQKMVVAVDDIESRKSRFDARPYALANPAFKTLPVFGEFRGHDNPERILSLDPQPQVIFKTATSGGMGYDPVELQQKTTIPVVVLNYGDLTDQRPQLYASLRLMAEVVGRAQRAEEVIAFFEAAIQDLHDRTAGIPPDLQPDVFLGGVAMRGPHGFQSTEPGYPPFLFVNARNVAFDKSLTGKALSHADVAKEKIIEWDPDILFLDLSTLQMGQDAGGLHELRTDPGYRMLTAVRKGKVYGLLPYNWYTQNYGSTLANAYFVGKLIAPERFADVEPRRRADEIYSFLVDKPVFDEMNALFQDMVFTSLPVN